MFQKKRPTNQIDKSPSPPIKQSVEASAESTVENISQIYISGDVHAPIRVMLGGVDAFSFDYSERIQSFLIEYLGNDNYKVPFGGRDSEKILSRSKF